MQSIIAKKSVLITGGAGFIGAALVKKLLEQGFEPHLLIKKSTDVWRLKNIARNIRFHEVSLLDEEGLRKVAHKISPVAIFHLATYADYRDQEKISQMIETNIEGTANLLLATVDIDYKVFVNTGSSSEYGFKKKAMREEDLLEPISFYAATKAGATLLAQSFAYYYKKPIVTFRPFSVYGPLEDERRFIPTAIKAVINGTPINLTPGDQRRDFIFIDDIVDAYIKSIKNGRKLSGKIVNIGTGKQYTNDEVVKKLFKVAGKKVKINKGTFPLRIWDSPYWVADISKAKKLMNWAPTHSLERGISKTYNWFTQTQ